ncbi:MAG TPA: hypothetical protein DCM71_12675 [Runella sp.]|nr:hypothetical protein [Runella sp.]
MHGLGKVKLFITLSIETKKTSHVASCGKSFLETFQVCLATTPKLGRSSIGRGVSTPQHGKRPSKFVWLRRQNLEGLLMFFRKKTFQVYLVTKPKLGRSVNVLQEKDLPSLFGYDAETW